MTPDQARAPTLSAGSLAARLQSPGVLVAMNPPKYAQAEIERRWLVDKNHLPPLGEARTRRIEDKYLSGGRLRLRRVSENDCHPIYKLGKKYLHQAEHPEPVVSIYLTESEYESLLSLPGQSAVKTRYTVAGGALDIYEFPRHGFAIFEVEFVSEQAAAAYAPPGFVGQEITRVAAYSGFALCQKVF